MFFAACGSEPEIGGVKVDTGAYYCPPPGSGDFATQCQGLDAAMPDAELDADIPDSRIADAAEPDDPECACDVVGHGLGEGHCKDRHLLMSQGHGNGHCKYDCELP
jgi:hypothetical protein